VLSPARWPLSRTSPPSSRRARSAS
jgi:hypothetical protein